MPAILVHVTVRGGQIRYYLYKSRRQGLIKSSATSDLTLRDLFR